MPNQLACNQVKHLTHDARSISIGWLTTAAANAILQLAPRRKFAIGLWHRSKVRYFVRLFWPFPRRTGVVAIDTPWFPFSAGEMFPCQDAIHMRAKSNDRGELKWARMMYQID